MLDIAAIRRLGEMERRASKGPWNWEGREQDEDGYVYVPQGSHLGHTMICLDDTYEGHGEDCDLISALRNHAQELLALAEEAMAARAKIDADERADAMPDRYDAAYREIRTRNESRSPQQ